MSDQHTKQGNSAQLMLCCFVDASRHLRGNTCEIRWYDSDNKGESVADAANTTVCVLRRIGSLLEFDVTCYFDRHRIQCCGHGLLAAAQCLLDTFEIPHCNLYMNHSAVHAYQDPQTTRSLVWLQFAPLALSFMFETGRTIHYGLSQKLGVSETDIELLTAVGTLQDYYIVECTEGMDLRQLTVPDASLADITSRALIVVARQTGSAEDIQYRYFAPQYGVMEDAATGSAMRLLAHYFFPEFTALSAVQCSPAGGALFSRCDGVQATIGGYIERVDT